MKRIYAIRGTPMDVSQEWLDANRGSLTNNKWWRIDGDTGITIDAGDDGIPDSGWTKKDITAWLKDVEKLLVDMRPSPNYWAWSS